MLELTEEVCQDSRRKGYMGYVVTVSCMCSPFESPTGFSRQMKLPDPTNNTNKIYKAAKEIFYKFWDRMPVRRLGVSLSSLMDAETYQVSFFDDKKRARSLEKATDSIKERYGNTAIVRASSLTHVGQALERSRKIGGHYK